MKKYFLLFLIFIYPLCNYAQFFVWTGNGGDQNWFNAANWDLNDVPDAGSTATISGNFTVEILSNAAFASIIDLEGGATLIIENDVTLSQAIFTDPTTHINWNAGVFEGGIFNENIMTIETISSKELKNGFIVNLNTINIIDSGTIDLSESTIDNEEGATIFIDSTGGLTEETGEAILNNYGLISISSEDPHSFYMIYDMHNYGRIHVGENQTFLFLVGSQNFTNYPNAVLEGDGTFDITANFVNDGIIKPGGDAVGTLDFVNNFSMSELSSLAIDIEGTAPGTFDVLNIFGAPNLDGSIAVQTTLTENDLGAQFPTVFAQLGINNCNFPSNINTIVGQQHYIFSVHCNPNDVTLELVDTFLGNETETFQSNWTLFPNPSRETIAVHIPENTRLEDVQLILYNELGQQLQTYSITTLQSELNISSLSQGVYFLKIENEGINYSVKRLIKI